MKKTAPAPAENYAFIMSPSDNVAVAGKDIPAGTAMSFGSRCFSARRRVPSGAVFALSDIGRREAVTQYGYPFGVSSGIKAGEVVAAGDVLSSDADIKKEAARAIGALAGRRHKTAPRAARPSPLSFEGYKRPGGAAGTRNYYLVIPASMCAADVASRIALAADERTSGAARLDGVVAAAHTEGCGSSDGIIIERLLSTLKNTALHPNVGGVLIVELGCEKTNFKDYRGFWRSLIGHGKPVDFLSVQRLGGTSGAVAAGLKIVRKRVGHISAARRTQLPLSYLVAGTECGASDAFSGVTANPLIGKAVDGIISRGGSAILSETPEMIGAEKYLMSRMASAAVVRKFVGGMEYYTSLARKLGVSLSGNFVPGNIAGGLINPSVKSLGAVQKGGSSTVRDCLDYAERIKKKGLNIMTGPGNDLESLTGMAASGANIFLFSTGMGATEGHITVPSIRITSRTEVFRNLRGDMDFDAGRLAGGKISPDALAAELLDMTISVASGKKTRSELLKKRSFQIWSAGKLSL
ncbi:MAG: hypothetical protein CVU77_00740 [Elusimicrobia bacterium HGW-Elusimicrobia-1]|nr:MAG: hypothetical protein CVU77_00740 [Elusimicrobia bacterium HGW-Elusimicrobia-1]